MIFVHPLTNLLLNMSSGLTPDELQPEEVEMLVKEYGKDWKLKLGYLTNLEYLEEKADEPKTA